MRYISLRDKMQIRKSKTRAPFNFELNRSFSRETLFIQSSDIDKSILAMAILCEHIRYCTIENYSCYDKKKLEKYCRLLLNYENCNQRVLVKECQNICKKILNDAMNQPLSLQSVEFGLSMTKSKYEFLNTLANHLLSNTMGRHVRSVN